MKIFDGFPGTSPRESPTASIEQQIASLGSTYPEDSPPEDSPEPAYPEPGYPENRATQSPSGWQSQPRPAGYETTLRSPGDWTSEAANILAIAFVFTAVELIVIKNASAVTAGIFLSLLHMCIVLLFRAMGKRLIAIHCGIAAPLATAVTFSFLYLI